MESRFQEEDLGDDFGGKHFRFFLFIWCSMSFVRYEAFKIEISGCLSRILELKRCLLDDCHEVEGSPIPTTIPSKWPHVQRGQICSTEKGPNRECLPPKSPKSVSVSFLPSSLNSSTCGLTVLKTQMQGRYILCTYL